MAKNDEVRVRMNTGQKARWQHVAQTQGKPLSRVVEEAMEKELERQQAEAERPFHEKQLREEIRSRLDQMRTDLHAFIHEQKRLAMVLELGGLDHDAVTRLALDKWDRLMALKDRPWSPKPPEGDDDA